MDLISQLDIRVFIHENYITLLALFGLLILMIEYRGVPIPGTRTQGLALTFLFLMTVSGSLELWGSASLDRKQIRVIASVVYYILSPALIWLELMIASDREGTTLTIRLPKPANSDEKAVSVQTGNKTEESSE